MSDLYTNPNDIPWSKEAVEISRMRQENHNHITRDIKPPGQCYSCDRYHAKEKENRILELEGLILSVEDLYESHGSQEAVRHLQSYIQTKNLREKHKQ